MRTSFLQGAKFSTVTFTSKPFREFSKSPEERSIWVITFEIGRVGDMGHEVKEGKNFKLQAPSFRETPITKLQKPPQTFRLM
jgi:hypothetical protein